jgi:hypothetical protein
MLSVGAREMSSRYYICPLTFFLHSESKSLRCRRGGGGVLLRGGGQGDRGRARARALGESNARARPRPPHTTVLAFQKQLGGKNKIQSYRSNEDACARAGPQSGPLARGCVCVRACVCVRVCAIGAPLERAGTGTLVCPQRSGKKKERRQREREWFRGTRAPPALFPQDNIVASISCSLCDRGRRTIRQNQITTRTPSRR